MFVSLPSPPLWLHPLALFSCYGQDMKTGFSRGFGYVNMSTPEEVESIISTSRHHINGLEVHTLHAHIQVFNPLHTYLNSSE